jgi:hypothetical protein
VKALAKSERLAGLKHLHLGDNPIGAGGLAALAGAVRLRGLRSLALDRCDQFTRKLNAEILRKFISALDMPELRHLNLDRLPVHVRGARAIVTNTSFRNLTRLGLIECPMGERGKRVIVESGAFPNLTVLKM